MNNVKLNRSTDKTENVQSHLALSGIAVPWLLRLAMQAIPTRGSNLQISPFNGGPGALSNTVLLGGHMIVLPNGITFHPVASAGCTCVTNRRTDVSKTEKQHYGKTPLD